MFELLLVLGILSLFFGGAYFITGAIFKALVWLFVMFQLLYFCGQLVWLAAVH